jgi:hypothetical protein
MAEEKIKAKACWLNVCAFQFVTSRSNWIPDNGNNAILNFTLLNQQLQHPFTKSSQTNTEENNTSYKRNNASV